MALLANGYAVSRPTCAEVYDLKAEDPLTGNELRLQVKTIHIRADRGDEWVVYAKKNNGEPYRKSEVDLFIGVLVSDGEMPRAYMFENREIGEYWTSEARASRRWIEMPIALDRSVYEGIEKEEAV